MGDSAVRGWPVQYHDINFPHLRCRTAHGTLTYNPKSYADLPFQNQMLWVTYLYQVI